MESWLAQVLALNACDCFASRADLWGPTACKDYLFRILREKCVRVDRLKAFDCSLDDSAVILGFHAFTKSYEMNEYFLLGAYNALRGLLHSVAT